MSLGELQGHALIGQPLDLIVPIQTSQGDELSEGCVRADIYYGEARQKTPRITSQASQLRLQISAPVNEPVVTVQIRNFCGASQIRNYVLLADLPPDFSASVAANTPAPAVQSDVSSVALAPVVVVLPQGSVAKTPKASLATPRKPASSTVKSKKAVKKQKTKAATTKRTRERKAASVQPGRSVLKLDPMELLSDRMDTLELNMPFVPAEDALLQRRQIAALQADLKSMRELAVKNDGTLLALQSQLKLAQSRQQLSTLFYGLIALLLLGVASLTWLWQRQKKLTLAAQSWWQHPTEDDLTAFLHPDATFQAARPGMAASLSEDIPANKTPHNRSDQADSVTLQGTGVDAIEKVQNESYSAVASAPIKISPEEVQDIRQQAEFFVSLGQADRAIHILNQHIATADRPNPLICMDLLALYQQANQTAEFDQLRDVCLQHFNVRLPELANFHQEGQDLAFYPEVLTTLTRLWPGEQAQAFMDTCLFLDARTKPKLAFDLAAFRDLLTLHTVVEELATQAPLDRPLDEQDVFPDLGLPNKKTDTRRAESPEGNLPDLDFVLPQDPPPGKP